MASRFDGVGGRSRTRSRTPTGPVGRRQDTASPQTVKAHDSTQKPSPLSKKPRRRSDEVEGNGKELPAMHISRSKLQGKASPRSNSPRSQGRLSRPEGNRLGIFEKLEKFRQDSPQRDVDADSTGKESVKGATPSESSTVTEQRLEKTAQSVSEESGTGHSNDKKGKDSQVKGLRSATDVGRTSPRGQGDLLKTSTTEESPQSSEEKEVSTRSGTPSRRGMKRSRGGGVKRFRGGKSVLSRTPSSDTPKVESEIKEALADSKPLNVPENTTSETVIEPAKTIEPGDVDEVLRDTNVSSTLPEDPPIQVHTSVKSALQKLSVEGKQPVVLMPKVDVQPNESKRVENTVKEAAEQSSQNSQGDSAQLGEKAVEGAVSDKPRVDQPRPKERSAFSLAREICQAQINSASINLKAQNDVSNMKGNANNASNNTKAQSDVSNLKDSTNNASNKSKAQNYVSNLKGSANNASNNSKAQNDVNNMKDSTSNASSKSNVQSDVSNLKESSNNASSKSKVQSDVRSLKGSNNTNSPSNDSKARNDVTDLKVSTNNASNNSKNQNDMTNLKDSTKEPNIDSTSNRTSLSFGDKMDSLIQGCLRNKSSASSLPASIARSSPRARKKTSIVEDFLASKKGKNTLTSKLENKTNDNLPYSNQKTKTRRISAAGANVPNRVLRQPAKENEIEKATQQIQEPKASKNECEELEAKESQKKAASTLAIPDKVTDSIVEKSAPYEDCLESRKPEILTYATGKSGDCETLAVDEQGSSNKSIQKSPKKDKDTKKEVVQQDCGKISTRKSMKKDKDAEKEMALQDYENKSTQKSQKKDEAKKEVVQEDCGNKSTQKSRKKDKDHEKEVVQQECDNNKSTKKSLKKDKDAEKEVVQQDCENKPTRKSPKKDKDTEKEVVQQDSENKPTRKSPKKDKDTEKEAVQQDCVNKPTRKSPKKDKDTEKEVVQQDCENKSTRKSPKKDKDAEKEVVQLNCENKSPRKSPKKDKDAEKEVVQENCENKSTRKSLKKDKDAEKEQDCSNRSTQKSQKKENEAETKEQGLNKNRSNKSKPEKLTIAYIEKKRRHSLGIIDNISSESSDDDVQRLEDIKIDVIYNFTEAEIDEQTMKSMKNIGIDVVYAGTSPISPKEMHDPPRPLQHDPPPADTTKKPAPESPASLNSIDIDLVLTGTEDMKTKKGRPKLLPPLPEVKPTTAPCTKTSQPELEVGETADDVTDGMLIQSPVRSRSGRAIKLSSAAIEAGLAHESSMSFLVGASGGKDKMKTARCLDFSPERSCSSREASPDKGHVVSEPPKGKKRGRKPGRKATASAAAENTGTTTASAQAAPVTKVVPVVKAVPSLKAAAIGKAPVLASMLSSAVIQSAELPTIPPRRKTPPKKKTIREILNITEEDLSVTMPPLARARESPPSKLKSEGPQKGPNANSEKGKSPKKRNSPSGKIKDSIMPVETSSDTTKEDASALIRAVRTATEKSTSEPDWDFSDTPITGEKLTSHSMKGVTGAETRSKCEAEETTIEANGYIGKNTERDRLQDAGADKHVSLPDNGIPVTTEGVGDREEDKKIDKLSSSSNIKSMSVFDSSSTEDKTGGALKEEESNMNSCNTVDQTDKQNMENVILSSNLPFLGDKKEAVHLEKEKDVNTKTTSGFVVTKEHTQCTDGKEMNSIAQEQGTSSKIAKEDCKKKDLGKMSSNETKDHQGSVLGKSELELSKDKSADINLKEEEERETPGKETEDTDNCIADDYVEEPVELEPADGKKNPSLLSLISQVQDNMQPCNPLLPAIERSPSDEEEEEELILEQEDEMNKTDGSLTDDSDADDSMADDSTSDESSTDESSTDGSATEESNDSEADDGIPDVSKAGDSKTDVSKADDSITDGSKADDSITDGSKADDSITDGSKADDSITDGSKADDSITDGSKADDSITDGSKADDSITKDSEADDSLADVSKADDSITDDNKANTSILDANEGGTTEIMEEEPNKQKGDVEKPSTISSSLVEPLSGKDDGQTESSELIESPNHEVNDTTGETSHTIEPEENELEEVSTSGATEKEVCPLEPTVEAEYSFDSWMKEEAALGSREDRAKELEKQLKDLDTFIHEKIQWALKSQKEEEKKTVVEYKADLSSIKTQDDLMCSGSNLPKEKSSHSDVNVKVKDEKGQRQSDYDVKPSFSSFSEPGTSASATPGPSSSGASEPNLHKLFEISGPAGKKKASAFSSEELDQYLTKNCTISKKCRGDEQLLNPQTAAAAAGPGSSLQGRPQTKEPEVDEVDGVVFHCFSSHKTLEEFIKNGDCPSSPSSSLTPTLLTKRRKSETYPVNIVPAAATATTAAPSLEDHKTPEKTHDVTKIKGWQKKYSPSGEGPSVVRTSPGGSTVSPTPEGAINSLMKIHWRTKERLLRNLTPDEIQTLGLSLKRRRRKVKLTHKKGAKRLQLQQQQHQQQQQKQKQQAPSAESAASYTYGGRMRPPVMPRRKPLRPATLTSSMVLSAISALKVNSRPAGSRCVRPGCRYGCMCRQSDASDVICLDSDGASSSSYDQPPRYRRCGRPDCRHGCICDFIDDPNPSGSAQEVVVIDSSSEKSDSSLSVSNSEQVTGRRAEMRDPNYQYSGGRDRESTSADPQHSEANQGQYLSMFGLGKKSEIRAKAENDAKEAAASNVRKSSRLKDKKGIGLIDNLKDLIYFDATMWADGAWENRHLKKKKSRKERQGGTSKADRSFDHQRVHTGPSFGESRWVRGFGEESKKAPPPQPQVPSESALHDLSLAELLKLQRAHTKQAQKAKPPQRPVEAGPFRQWQMQKNQWSSQRVEIVVSDEEEEEDDDDDPDGGFVCARTSVFAPLLRRTARLARTRAAKAQAKSKGNPPIATKDKPQKNMTQGPSLQNKPMVSNKPQVSMPKEEKKAEDVQNAMLPKIRKQMVLLQRNHAKQAGKDKKSKKEPVIKTEGEEKPPHLLEVQSNCVWAPIRSHLLNQISIIADREDLPPVGHKLCRRIGEFVVEIRPPAKESTTLPPNLQSAHCKSLPAIRIMITKAGTSVPLGLQEGAKAAPASSVPRLQTPGSPTANAAPSKPRGPPNNITIQNVVTGSSIFPQGSMINSNSQPMSSVNASPFGLSSLSRLNINAPGCVKQGEGSFSVQTRLSGSSFTQINNIGGVGKVQNADSREVPVVSSLKEQGSDSSQDGMGASTKKSEEQRFKNVSLSGLSKLNYTGPIDLSPAQRMGNVAVVKVSQPVTLPVAKDQIVLNVKSTGPSQMRIPSDPLKLMNKKRNSSEMQESSGDEDHVGIYVMSANGDVKHVKTKVGTGIRKEDFQDPTSLKDNNDPSTHSKGGLNANGPPPAKRLCENSDSNIQNLSDALNQPALSIKRRLSASELPKYSWDEIRRLSVDYTGTPCDSAGGNQTVMSNNNNSTSTTSATATSVMSVANKPPAVSSSASIPCSNPNMYNQYMRPAIPPQPAVCPVPRRGPGPRVRLPTSQRSGPGCGPRIRIPLSMLQAQGAKALSLGQPVTVNLTSATSPPARRGGVTSLMTVPPAIRLPAPVGQTIQRIMDGQVMNPMDHTTQQCTSSRSPTSNSPQMVNGEETATDLHTALSAHGLNTDAQVKDNPNTTPQNGQSISRSNDAEKALNLESSNDIDSENVSVSESGHVSGEDTRLSESSTLQAEGNHVSEKGQGLISLCGDNSPVGSPNERTEPMVNVRSDQEGNEDHLEDKDQSEHTDRLEDTDQVESNQAVGQTGDGLGEVSDTQASNSSAEEDPAVVILSDDDDESSDVDVDVVSTEGDRLSYLSLLRDGWEDSQGDGSRGSSGWADSPQDSWTDSPRDSLGSSWSNSPRETTSRDRRREGRRDCWEDGWGEGLPVPKPKQVYRTRSPSPPTDTREDTAADEGRTCRGGRDSLGRAQHIHRERLRRSDITTKFHGLQRVLPARFQPMKLSKEAILNGGREYIGALTKEEQHLMRQKRLVQQEHERLTNRLKALVYANQRNMSSTTASSPWSSELPRSSTETTEVDRVPQRPGVRKRVRGQWGPASKRRKAPTSERALETAHSPSQHFSADDPLPLTITSVRSLVEEAGGEGAGLSSSAGEGKRLTERPGDRHRHIPADAQVINIDD